MPDDIGFASFVPDANSAIYPGGGPLPLQFLTDMTTATAPDGLVRKLLGTESLAVVYGEPGSGKTFMATDMALHVAMGRNWLGRPVKCGAVLYVAAEGSAGLVNRLIAFKKEHDVDDGVPFAVVPATVNLGPGGSDASRVIAAAGELADAVDKPVVLVVIDTLARAMGAGDENAAKDMGAFVGACDQIRTAIGCTVLVVHHQGKSSAAGMRGSTALLGAADTVIHVEKRANGRAARVEKQKDGEEVEIGFDLEVVTIGEDDQGEPITSCLVRPCDDAGGKVAKLTGKAGRALDVLRNTLVDRPEQRPNSVTFPNVTLTRLEAWREALKTAGVTERDNPTGERQSFKRIKEKLDEVGIIRMHGDYVWIVP